MLTKCFCLILINCFLIGLSYSEIKVVLSAALIDRDFDLRKAEYIKCIKILENYGYKNPYVIEAIKLQGPTFLNQYSSNVFYSKANDASLGIANKGVNEARTMFEGLQHFNFKPNDMIIKITGRYHLISRYFIDIVENNPDIDVFGRLWYDGTLMLTSCFAMRYSLLIDMLQTIDYDEMSKNQTYIETKVLQYVDKLLKSKKAKVMFMDKLDLFCNIMGLGNYGVITV